MGEKKAIIQFIFWGLGIFGFGLLVIFAIDIVKAAFTQNKVLWSREIWVVLVGIASMIIGSRGIHMK